MKIGTMDMKNLRAAAVGMEFFLPTAGEDALGSGATSLGPQIFGVVFKKFGFDLIAPAYQHKFSVDKESGRQHVRCHSGAGPGSHPRRWLGTAIDHRRSRDGVHVTRAGRLGLSAGCAT